VVEVVFGDDYWVSQLRGRSLKGAQSEGGAV